MNYYRVLYCEEYSKRNGEFSIIDCKDSINEYALKDEIPFPSQMIDNSNFFLKDINKRLADIQMSYFPWRFISKKAYLILNKFSNKDEVYFHEVDISIGTNNSTEYYIMQFLKTYDILIKDDKSKNRNLLTPFISTEGLDGIDVLMYDKRDPSVFLISEKVKNEFEIENISGAHYQKINKSS